MPELPEVETIKRGLEKFILHKKLVKVEVLEEKAFKNVFSRGLLELTSEDEGPSPATAGARNPSPEKHILNAKVSNLRRFGKALVIDFDNGMSFLIHLRMTGQLIWVGKERFAGGHPNENFVANLPNKQTRVILEFEDGKLYFNDQRKFGFIKVLETKQVESETFVVKLAKEPWQMSAEELLKVFERHKNAPIKAVLLDQTNIAGLGNIYTDETLFFAGIHPATKAGKLDQKDAEKILEGARKTMTDSIDAGGSTMATYVKADGTRGNYLDKFAQVFGREGQECARCGDKIIKIKVAGRGTHICSSCQKVKND